MKKSFFIFIMIGLCAATIFALDLDRLPFSIGGGGNVTGSFSTWKVDQDLPGSLSRYNSNHLSVAPYFFVDLKYVELNLGLPLGFLNADATMSADPNFPATTFALNGGVYLKMPFAVTQTISIFPLLGIDYDLYLLAKRDDDRDAVFPVSTSKQNAKPIDALNALWFKAGIGMDSFLTENIFFRTEILYGVRLKNEMEKYLFDQRSDVDWMIGNGGTFKIAAGYRF